MDWPIWPWNLEKLQETSKPVYEIYSHYQLQLPKEKGRACQWPHWRFYRHHGHCILEKQNGQYVYIFLNEPFPGSTQTRTTWCHKTTRPIIADLKQGTWYTTPWQRECMENKLILTINSTLKQKEQEDEEEDTIFKQWQNSKSKQANQNYQNNTRIAMENPATSANWKGINKKNCGKESLPWCLRRLSLLAKERLSDISNEQKYLSAISLGFH